MKIFNSKEYKSRRQRLRADATWAEKYLWQYLKSNQLGAKFRRQYGVGAYVVDFYCPSLKVAIEVDGDVHALPEQITHDETRTRVMNKLGIMVLRFTNDDIDNTMDGVIERIQEVIEVRRTAPSPEPPLSPPWKGGGPEGFAA